MRRGIPRHLRQRERLRTPSAMGRAPAATGPLPGPRLHFFAQRAQRTSAAQGAANRRTQRTMRGHRKRLHAALPPGEPLGEELRLAPAAFAGGRAAAPVLGAEVGAGGQEDGGGEVSDLKGRGRMSDGGQWTCASKHGQSSAAICASFIWPLVPGAGGRRKCARGGRARARAQLPPAHSRSAPCRPARPMGAPWRGGARRGRARVLRPAHSRCCRRTVVWSTPRSTPCSLPHRAAQGAPRRRTPLAMHLGAGGQPLGTMQALVGSGPCSAGCALWSPHELVELAGGAACRRCGAAAQPVGLAGAARAKCPLPWLF